MYFFVENLEFESLNAVINNTRFKILEHGFLNTGSEWKFTNLSSPFNRLYFVISGSARINNEYNDLELKGGNVYLIPLYNTYDYICENSLNKFYIHFRIELLSEHDLFEGCRYCSSLPVDNGIMDILVQSAKSGGIGDFIRCKGIFLDYIGRFMAPYSDNINEQIQLSSKYEQLYRYISENCYADLRVNELAESMNTSLSNLSRSFKYDTGMNLKKFLEKKIIHKAQEMLLVTDRTVKDIAYELRFLDEFHFSRFFKRCIGISPNKYRQRNNTFK